MSEGKQQVTITICGAIDRYASIGRLIFELGGVPERQMQKLREEASTLNKSIFSHYMDVQASETERGIGIVCDVKEFFTSTKHYTITHSPGHRDFIRNIITGVSRVDAALIMVSADEGKDGETLNMYNQKYALLLNLLDVKHIIVGINQIDMKSSHSEVRYLKVRDETILMLEKAGWDRTIIEKEIPFVPIVGWMDGW